MSLLSPGVQVSVIDQSNYTPAAASSVPFILLATAANKISGAGTGIAPGTLTANANQLYLMTSQRDLLATFGVPFFYNTTSGTPINGYELNEYGLLAAYSALGVTNIAYIMRADIDLAALTASLNRPVGAPVNGTFWLDTTNSTWGLNQWNLNTSAFTQVTPSVITDTSFLETESTVPLASYGSIGDYAVTATSIYNPIYYKRGGPTGAQAPGWIQQGASAAELYNTWVLVGSDDWKTSFPAITGTNAPTSITASDTFKINGVTITVQSSPNNTVTQIAASINGSGLNDQGVFAANIGGKLSIYGISNALGAHATVTGASGADGVATLTFSAFPTAPYAVGDIILVSGINPSGYNGTYTVTACTTTSVSYANATTTSYSSGGSIACSINNGGTIYIQNGTGTPLTTLGITPGEYYVPQYAYGPNYSAPRWRSTDLQPAPTGSVFQQTNTPNQGMLTQIKRYDSTLGTFVLQACPVYTSDANAIYALDPISGGQTIPAGTTYALIDPYSNTTGGLLILERIAPGATVVTGTINNPAFSETTLAVTGASGSDGIATLTFSTQTSAPYVVGSQITVSGIDPSGYNGTYTVTACTTTTVSYENATTTSYSSGGSILGYSTFTLTATQPETNVVNRAVVITIEGTTSADFVAAVSAAGIPNVSAGVNAVGAIYFTHATGGDIYLADGTGTPLATAGFTTAIPNVRYQKSTPGNQLIFSNWVSSPAFTYTADSSQPNLDPADGTYWYYSDATTADIMIQNNGQWVGYQNCVNDVRGYNLSLTNAAGPIFSATAPTTQTNAALSPLSYGDLWINTSDLEDYPIISRWENINGVDQWVQISNTDQTTINGILFADARWAPNGTTNPITDPIPPIATGTTPLITSDYLDLDAPNPLLYPEGILLWNTRRSGFNVKSFAVNYFNSNSFSGVELPSQTNTWLSASGTRIDGSPNMGRQSQRDLIVKAMRAAMDTSSQLRDQAAQFNLIAVPGYPELAPDMRVLNDDRGDTAFNVVDTPMRLPGDSTSLITWATNNNGAGIPTGDGNLASGDPYSGAFYPSCTTTDLSGNLVVQPPSHMMIRTIIRSDSVAYPWFAPAGLRRGVVDNAQEIGYINAQTGVFNAISVNQGLRDVLYSNDVNPITFIPGTGIVNFGNHTLQGTATALDRINVARLVAYIRGRLEIIGNQYLFEPNDTITRNAITNQITALMTDLVNKRGLYDYLVVCDLTNNTPATIDANELYVDIAIEPVKAVEFIYIPMRIQNTGTIQAQASA